MEDYSRFIGRPLREIFFPDRNRSYEEIRQTEEIEKTEEIQDKLKPRDRRANRRRLIRLFIVS